jgi:hypothetical protein
VYATIFSSQANYQFDKQRYPNILGGSGGVLVGENNSRTIVNMSVHKKFMDDKLKVSLFGNDIFNTGIVASTSSLSVTTLSQIEGMYGASISYKF